MPIGWLSMRISRCDVSTASRPPHNAAGMSALGEGGRLLGCFRSSGLLIPVWEVDPDTEAGEFESAVAQMKDRIEAAVTRLAPVPEPAGRWTRVVGDEERQPFAPASFDLAVSLLAGAVPG